MFDRPTVVQFKKDGPKGAIRKMRDAAVDVLPVEDSKEKFMGYVWLEDMLKLEKEKAKTVESALNTEVPSVYKHYTVEDMLPLITGHHHPLAVVDEKDGRLIGLVTQTSLIIESTRFEDKEMGELIDKANEL
jgi:glycine betaine/proline transport system ATP-binding protein